VAQTVLAPLQQDPSASRQETKGETTTNYYSQYTSKITTEVQLPLPNAGDKTRTYVSSVMNQYIMKNIEPQHLSLTDMFGTWSLNSEIHDYTCNDLTALDAVYHKKCLTALYTRNRSLTRKNEASTRDNLTPESLPLAELMSYMEDYQDAEHPMGSIFKLFNLVKLYTERITRGHRHADRHHPGSEQLHT